MNYPAYTSQHVYESRKNLENIVINALTFRLLETLKLIMLVLQNFPSLCTWNYVKKVALIQHQILFEIF